jgi:hypothetical protein
MEIELLRAIPNPQPPPVVGAVIKLDVDDLSTFKTLLSSYIHIRREQGYAGHALSMILADKLLKGLKS